jgi:hypothetical protein
LKDGADLSSPLFASSGIVTSDNTAEY